LQPRDIKHEIENVKERWKFYRVYRVVKNCLNRLIDFANYFFIELLAFAWLLELIFNSAEVRYDNFWILLFWFLGDSLLWQFKCLVCRVWMIPDLAAE